MASVTGILESIRTIISGVTGIGQVYARRRYLPQDKDFQTAATTGSRVNYWDMYRVGSTEAWPNRFQFQRTHQIAIRGYFSAQDAQNTDATFHGMVDRLQNRFRLESNRTLNNAEVESLGRGEQAGLQVQTVDYAMFHGVLCHSLQARLTVIEKPTTVLTVGATLTSYTGPRIFYANSIGASSMLNPSSTNASFPKSLMLDEAPKTPWRSASLGSPSVTIDIDFGAATVVRAFALKNHNFSAGTYKLYRGDSSPASTVVTLSTKTSLQWVTFFATHSNRYWRFSMREDGIASGFYQIGELWLGGRVVDLTKWHAGGSQESDDDAVTEHETDGGQRWRLSGHQREARTYHFKDIDEDADWVLWKRVFDNRGRTHPFYFVVNPAVPSSAFFCSFRGPLSKRIVNTDQWDVDVRLEEEL